MDAFWDFFRGTVRSRGNVRTPHHIWQVRGGRDGKRADIFMFKEKSGRRRKEKGTKQQKVTKPKSEEKKVSHNTISKSNRGMGGNMEIRTHNNNLIKKK